MTAQSGFKTRPTKFNIEFDIYMSVWSRFKIEMRQFKIVAGRSCLLFAQFGIVFRGTNMLLPRSNWNEDQRHERRLP